MTRTGTCQIVYGGKRRNGLISLDFEEARIKVSFMADLFEEFGRKQFDRDYAIDNVHIGLPNGEIQNGRIKKLLLVGGHTQSAQNASQLITAFPISDRPDSGQKVLFFVPRQSLIRLPITGLSGQELLFGVNRLRLKDPRLSFRVGRYNAQLFNDTTAAIAVRGHGNLLRWRETIGRAISLMQGGPVNYRAGFSGSTVEINFIRDSDVKALGRAYDEDESLAEFLQRYIAYEQSLADSALQRHRLAVSYILDGCAGLPSLEQKAISLFTAVEILDGSRTLSAAPVARLLAIKQEQAKVLVEVRNKIVHEALSLHGAITRARHALQTHGRLPSLPFRVTGVSKTVAAANLHLFLASSMIAAVAERIGMSRLPISYLKIYRY